LAAWILSAVAELSQMSRSAVPALMPVSKASPTVCEPTPDAQVMVCFL
jgi:hypothetical protein